MLVGRTFETAQAQTGTLMQSMRGVVYKALYAASIGQSDLGSEASAEASEFAASFEGAIEAQTALQLPSDIRTGLDEVFGPLTDYIAATQTVVSQAATGQKITKRSTRLLRPAVSRRALSMRSMWRCGRWMR